MKRLMSVLLTCMLLFSLAACGGKDTGTVPENTETDQTQETPAPETLPEEVPQESEPVLLPLQVWKGSDYVEEWDDDFNQLIFASWEEIASIDGYPELSAALEELNTEQAVGGYSFWQEWLPYAQEEMAANPEYFGGYTSESTYVIQRADSLVFSIREDYGSFTGGAHGNYGAMGWTFDTATGARLALADVLTDTDSLDEILAEKIPEKYTMIPFDSLDEMLAEYAPEDYTWTLGYQGITFYFSPYEIAPYAAGLLTATIWFDEMPELFYEDYLLAPEAGYAVALPDWNDVDVDLSAGDDTRDSLACWTYPGEYGEKYLTISMNGQEYAEETWCAFDITPYLVCVGEPGGEQFYLYVEGSGENDYRTLYIYDLNEGMPQLISDFSGAGFVGSWDSDAGTDGIYYVSVFNDPSEFTLGSKCNLLGTKTAYRNYTVDADGSLLPLNDVYDLEEDLDSIISTVPLEVTLLPQNTTETVPEGTEFFFLRTDNETWVDLVMTDGQECRIVIEEIDWTPCINGIPEWECFENLMYAG